MKKNKLGKVTMNSARDYSGNGTLVSSIAAGNYVNQVSHFGYAKGMAIGVAPRAKIAMYKVLWKEGYEEADVLAAIESAIVDGVDVINFSIAMAPIQHSLMILHQLVHFLPRYRGFMFSREQRAKPFHRAKRISLGHNCYSRHG